MSSNRLGSEEANYRALFGKLFSVLVKQFGTDHLDEIEDALQNSFLKSIKRWSTTEQPDKLEHWLFIVARNDILNQIKHKNKTQTSTFNHLISENLNEFTTEIDLRLNTILVLASVDDLSSQAKSVFILKNIFGLHIREISECTLIGEEAIYKGIQRSKKRLKQRFKQTTSFSTPTSKQHQSIIVVEEILYAVFNVGFDSFTPQEQSIVNEDICLEALALAKELYSHYQQKTTKNLLSLFCFHLSRLPAKVKKGKLISLFDQNRSHWNQELLNLGFYYLDKPKESNNRYYLEALIVSRYMTNTHYDIQHWEEITHLYEILLRLHPSPIIQLNYCYALHQANKTEQARLLLEKTKKQLPKDHFYYKVVSKQLTENSPQPSAFIPQPSSPRI